MKHICKTYKDKSVVTGSYYVVVLNSVLSRLFILCQVYLLHVSCDVHKIWQLEEVHGEGTETLSFCAVPLDCNIPKQFNKQVMIYNKNMIMIELN